MVILNQQRNKLFLGDGMILKINMDNSNDTVEYHIVINLTANSTVRDTRQGMILGTYLTYEEATSVLIQLYYDNLHINNGDYRIYMPEQKIVEQN